MSEAISSAEEEAEAAYEVTEAALSAMSEAVDKAEKTTKGRSEGKETRGKMEARLESLAKMYEVKRAQQGKQSKKEADAGDSKKKKD